MEWMVGSYAEPWRTWKEKEGRKEICDIEGHYNKRLGIVSSCLVKTDRLLSSDIAKLKAAYMEKRNT